MALRFRLGKKDAVKYERGGEEFVFDLDVLLDLPASKMIEIESRMAGYTFGLLRSELYTTETARAIRAVLYVSRRLAGVEEKWQDFDPAVHRVEWTEPETDDDDQGDTEDPTGATDGSPTS